MNTQGTHKLFLYRLHEIWICQCENLTSSTPHRRRLSKPRALGADGGVSLGQATCWLTGAAGWNVLLFYFPAKMPVVLLERPNPHWQWEHHQARGQGHLALQLELAWLFSVHHGEGGRGKRERAVVMHEYDGQYYYVFLKKMRWCHREDVSVLVLNSRR